MKITRTHKAKLFRMAHALKGKFENFGQALAHAWKVLKLKVRMQLGNVRFKFIKADGSIREAVGTLNIQYERKTGYVEQFKTLPYYDCEKNGWRAFKLENLV